jgi:hypothetical protein
MTSDLKPIADPYPAPQYVELSMLIAQSSIRLLGLCLAIHFVPCATARAWEYDLADGNSSVTINADSDHGMSNWTVGGHRQLHREWSWFRNGSSGPEKPIDRVHLVSVDQSSPVTLTTLYRPGGQFSIDVSYTLLGGAAGSGSSTAGEQIKFTNLSEKTLGFHFFQYVDFDLGGCYLGDTVQLGQDAIGLYNSANQHKGNSYFADELVSPGAQHGEVGLSPAILAKLRDSSPITLMGTTRPLTSDATWAFQWDAAIPVDGSFCIGLNQSVHSVPEPAALVLIPAGLMMLRLVRRRFFAVK